MTKPLVRCALTAFAVTLAGCVPRLDLAPVSGVVTLDGQPLTGVHVSFQPVRSNAGAMGMGSYGRTSSDGRYDLRLVEPDLPGAIPGLHRVRIRRVADADLPDDAPTAEDRLPSRYRDGTLMFEIPAAGTSSADFALQSNPR